MPLVSGQYQGTDFIQYEIDDYIDADLIDRALGYVVEHGEESAIVSVFMTPKAFTPDYEYHHIDTRQVVSFGTVKKTRTIIKPSTIDGYTPVNRKLYTFPYLYLTVDTLNDAKNYRFEFSETIAALHFTAYMAYSPIPEIVIAPQAYNGTTGLEPEDDDRVTARNFTEAVIMSGFPQCSFAIDSYRAWLAQKASGQALGLLGQVGGAIAGIAAAPATGGLSLGLGMSSAIGIAQSINQVQKDMTQGSRVRGDTAAQTDVAIRSKAIYFKTMGVSSEYAQNIDGFFDKFGYAQNKFTIPNRLARPHWTYLKTSGCNILSSGDGIPADAIQRIKEIYDNGITFWASLGEVGNYNQDNRPII